MYKGRAPYRCGLFKMVYNCCETGFGRTKDYSSGYDLVFGSVRGLHCTWLVPCMRASSGGMDDSDSGKWIYLKRGAARAGCKVLLVILSQVCFCVVASFLKLFRCVLCVYTSSIAPGLGSHFETYSLVLRGTQIPYSAAVDLVAGLGVSQVVSEP
ncbi:hypothetical protein M9H77_14424 [Catharanthus roseus]|uniref:Uncharacterized protein n=1 Tax=Catharanthus roseus TaxID=4058 RepID=A0ACC0BN05_CATRO|nr:hypothetical protein M9H77_14424 [Catharanthus roseus]